MMKRIVLLSGLLLLLSCAGCGYNFTIPEDGEKMSYDELSADGKGKFYLKLSEYNRFIEYKHFSIDRRGLEQLRIYIKENSPERAVWRSPDMLQSRNDVHNLTCIAVAELLPPAYMSRKQDAALLTDWCREFLFRTNMRLVNATVKPVLYQEKHEAVEYSFSYRHLNHDMQVRGIMCFLPDQPGRIMNIYCGLKVSGNRELERYREFSDRFLRAIAVD